jgi:hypothetical protein
MAAHVALPAGKLRDPVNKEVIFCALVVCCFANPEDAEAFAKHFGGERLPRGRGR